MKEMKVHFKRNFFAGLVTLLPIWLTIIIIWVVFKWVSSICMPVLVPLSKHFLGKEWVLPTTIVSFFLTIFLIWFVGVLTTLIISKKFIIWIENLLVKIPLLSSIYSALRKLTRYVFKHEDRGFKSVAMVEFPKPGTFALGFVIGPTEIEAVGKRIRVFIPHAPNPTTGFLIFAEEHEVRPVNMTFDEALRAVISGGIVMPEKLEKAKQDVH